MPTTISMNRKTRFCATFVCMHASDSGYDKITQWWSGGSNEFLAFDRNAFQATMDLLGRPISDSLSALICHGVFQRHPNLRVVSVENGASWVESLLHRLKKAYGQMPKAFAENPMDTFRRHIYVAPFYEDDMDALKNLIPVERILFGSDYPHPEGVAEPLAYLKEFENYRPDQIEKAFHSNLKGLLEGKRD
jgi:predicted TIM-barrel fold metal-dependent hydrolase